MHSCRLSPVKGFNRVVSTDYDSHKNKIIIQVSLYIRFRWYFHKDNNVQGDLICNLLHEFNDFSEAKSSSLFDSRFELLLDLVYQHHHYVRCTFIFTQCSFFSRVFFFGTQLYDIKYSNSTRKLEANSTVSKYTIMEDTRSSGGWFYL